MTARRRASSCQLHARRRDRGRLIRRGSGAVWTRRRPGAVGKIPATGRQLLNATCHPVPWFPLPGARPLGVNLNASCTFRPSCQDRAQRHTPVPGALVGGRPADCAVTRCPRAASGLSSGLGHCTPAWTWL